MTVVTEGRSASSPNGGSVTEHRVPRRNHIDLQLVTVTRAGAEHRKNRRQLLRDATALTAAALAGGGWVQHDSVVRAWQAPPGGHVQAVVSSDVAATQAGMQILAAGGSAADAAIAVAGMLSVVEPWFSSVLGGGTWALYYEAATGEVTSLDGIGPVGSNATLEDYRGRVDTFGIHQAIVPGAWDGWMRWLDRFGRLALGTVLDPAIQLAQAGHPVSSEMARWLVGRQDEILSLADTANLYAPNGELPVEGELLQQAAMAETFSALVQAYNDAVGESRSQAVQAARDYYYRGPLAEAIVGFSDVQGGYLTLDDFRTFEAQIVKPISIEYGDNLRVFENPPNSQGITMLLALNILKGFGLGDYEHASADAIHLQVEALKLAFADRYQYIGDPARIDIPLDDLLSEEHAAAQRDRIDLDATQDWPIESTRAVSHTSTFHIVDQEGNAAAVTTSLGGQFLVVGETGIHINERMSFLSLADGNANQLTPGYKVRHTSCPYLVLRDGRPYILGGNTGVDTQPQGQLQQFLSVVEYGMDAQDAIDAPRFVSTAFPASNYPYEVGNTLQLQEGFAEQVIAELQARGHDVVVGEGIFGSANMIIVDDDGTDADVGVESATSRSSGEVIPANG